mgnify:CR=1 FL=1
MIYVHVPFCRSFCTYCDFYSEIAADSAFGPYTDSLCREIRSRRDEMDGSTLRTLYFGGGTPTVLPLSCLSRILLALEETGNGGPWEEFTMEANPDDVVTAGSDYIRSLKLLGVNRISLGVQSFDDGLLRWMNRRHDGAAAEESVRMVREAGIGNVSIDLIFGINGLEDSVWEDTIDRAVATGAKHISCYQLSMEGESALAGMLSRGEYTEASDTLCSRQYGILCRKLAAAGFRHYEISNFALPGYEAVHNAGYWARVPYTGLGPSAHSFRGNVRSWNSDTLSDWTRSEETLSPEDERVETIMLSLRTDRGISEGFLHRNCSKESLDEALGRGDLVPAVPGRLRIPEEKMFVSDAIIRQLI